MKNDIDNGMSLYLDLLRFLAAIAVVMSHVWRLIFPDFPLPWPGHAAVIVFFVISGYVIAYATDRPDQSPGRYAMHRAVRILSVTVPALLLSVCIAPVAGTAPIPLAGQIPFPAEEFWHAIWINLLFLGESSWLNRVLPPFNPPYWSLSYEVWYYVIFGVWAFSNARWRLAAALVLTLCAGLKIALLLPVWLFGVAVYRARVTFDADMARRLFIFTALLAFAFFWFDIAVKIRAVMMLAWPGFMQDLHGSDLFVGDYLLAVLVAINFIAAASMGRHFDGLLRWRRPIRYLASFTLTTYLLHLPLTVLIWNGLGVHSVPAYALFLMLGIYMVGLCTERRNRAIKNWFESLAGRRREAAAQTRGR